MELQYTRFWKVEKYAINGLLKIFPIWMEDG